jgi:hypothetical protein
VVNGSEEVANKERGFTARSMAWSASSAASCGEGEVRPEVFQEAATSGSSLQWALLCKTARRISREMRERKRREGKRI